MRSSDAPMSHLNRPALILAIATVGVLIAGCARTGSSASDDTPVPPAASTDPAASADAPASEGAMPSLPLGDVPTAKLQQVIADAASGAGVDPSDVRVVTAEAVTWSDGSLGCPEPGMMYTQALVPGYRVVLEIDGEEMSFHASESGDFAFCEDPQQPVDDGTVDR